MKKRVQIMLGGACYVLGLAAAIYIGGVLMFLHPIHELYTDYCMGALTVVSVAVNAVKILFSTTIAGFVWCIGYIGYNHFKGTDDPDWEELNARIEK